jgi:Flp pilus assembly pilin Flp
MTARLRSQRGQAMTEYLVVGVFCVAILVAVSAGPQPVQELLDAIKNFFRAYSYVISVTS